MVKSEIAKAFSHGKFEICFEYLTDQTIWNTPGEQILKGRKEIEVFSRKISDYFNSVQTHFNQINLIESDNCVSINGTAEFIRDGKRVSFISSCDVYEFDSDNKIKSIMSYCITERP
jgi:ketosteroid isomerase-like protein